MPSTLTLPVPRNLSLPHTVCSYGYFILAPNRWTPVDKPFLGRFIRPLRLPDNTVVNVTVSQPKPAAPLRVRCDRTLDRPGRDAVRRQLARILRLDENLDAFHTLHPAARRARFARLFRSPTLFEDIVKTMTSCNVTWPSTVRMNRLLVAEPGCGLDFPTPDELAPWRPDRLARRCKVGYRAERIIRLARDVARSRLNLDELEDPALPTTDLYERLIAIHGIGPFAANNILQLLGRYDRLAVDSETLRHFRQVHGVHGDLKKVTRLAHRHYNRYAPYQFLAYWFELWGHYEGRQRQAWKWKESSYEAFTARNMK